MTTIDTPSGSSLDFSGFNSFDTKNNPTLERAKNTLQKLAQLIIENNGNLEEPMIVGLQGKPGLGKSHLIDAFHTAIRGIQNIDIAKAKDTHYFFSTKSNYNQSPIIITDDLFQRAANLDEVFTQKNWDKGWYPGMKLPEFLFDLYDNKKIWIVSSNFDIKEILAEVAKMDGQDRLSSRINHLLATTGTLHLEGEDHRRILAETGTRFSSLFQDK